jgi:beta-glucosidase-like glycosyl hydrolase
MGGHGAGIPSGTGTLGGNQRLGIPALETADGPAGLRIDSATAWPIGTMLACMWNPELMERVGEAVGDEMLLNNVDIWLAPGMNIHRNPLCGRNFEYYSEDPLISGKTAAALTRGVQSREVGVTLKHYAFNNQEQARNSTSNSVMTERAAREIYLKGFEIAIKEGDPFCIMSSYNLMNGKETSERWDLITGIPSGEWGWHGIMMTDWGNGSNNALEALAGNDIKMSSGSVTAITSAVSAGTLSVGQLRENVMDILATTIRSRKLVQETVITVTPIPAAGRTRIEAEDFGEVTGAPQAESCSDVGGGRDLGYMDAGGSATYYIDVARDGVYGFTFRYAGNSGTGGRLRIFDNGADTGIDVIETNTGGWQNWQTLAPISVPLAAGEHRLTLSITQGGGNLNWFDVERDLGQDISLSPNYGIYISDGGDGGGEFSVELALNRAASVPDGGVTLAAAAYDPSGRLIAIETAKIAGIPVAGEGEGYIMAVAATEPLPDAARFKFFVLNDSYSPLTATNYIGTLE